MPIRVKAIVYSFRTQEYQENLLKSSYVTSTMIILDDRTKDKHRSISRIPMPKNAKTEVTSKLSTVRSV